jgi:DNA-binding HxlR family transcriptional regulator
MEQSDGLAAIREICEGLSEADDAVARELMSRVADKWSLWVMGVLADARGAIRYARVFEGVGEISQKSLTQTLRHLERDGLITRQMFMEVPPRVEYCLTPLGLELLTQVAPLWLWIVGHSAVFQAARKSYDDLGDGAVST